MKIQLTTLALGLALTAGGICHHVHHQYTAVAIASVQDATGAVNKLYRNETHSLPATDLTSAKITRAHQALEQVPTAKLTDQQRSQVTQAQEELNAAAQMLTVTTVTQAPVTATPSYHQAAQKAIVAYHNLQTVKPVFTQVYQQPVAALTAAAEASTDLTSATPVTEPAEPVAVAVTEAPAPSTAVESALPEAPDKAPIEDAPQAEAEQTPSTQAPTAVSASGSQP